MAGLKSLAARIRSARFQVQRSQDVRLQDLRSQEKGQGLIEYVLILGLITLIGYATLGQPGNTVNEMITRAADSVATVS